MHWMDRWAARAQRKSDERAARWQARQEERARRGRMTITDRTVAHAQRKSDERLARWQARQQKPPRPPWPPGRYLLTAGGSFVIAIAAISVGTTSQSHHVLWLSEMMADLTGLALGGVIVGLLKARKARRALRYPRDWLAQGEGQPKQRSRGKKS